MTRGPRMLWCLLVVILQFLCVSSVPLHPEEELLLYLRTNHSRYSRPRLDPNSAVSVHASLTLLDLQHLDEVAGSLKLTVRLQLNWTDEVLQWDATNAGNIHSVVLSSNDVWLPQLHILNAVDADFQLSTDGAYVRLESSGQVLWVSTHNLEVSCPVETFYMPFDHQRCPVNIASHLQPAAQLNITPLFNYVLLDGVTVPSSNAPWCLKASTVRDKAYQWTNPAAAETYAGIQAEVVLQRKSSLFVLYILIPTCLFSLLLLAQFGLSPESGERVAVGAQTLIGYILFLLLTSPYVAMTSSIPSTLGMYMSILLFLKLLTMMVHILVSHLHTNVPESRPPSWLRRLGGACGACAEVKPPLDREPSYLSHMQMLRERVQSLSQNVMASQDVMSQVPEWNREPPNRLPPSAPVGPDSQMSSGTLHDLQQLSLANMPWNNAPEDRPPAPPPLDTQPRGRPAWPPGEPRMPAAVNNNLEILLARQLHLLRTITDKLHEQGQTESIIREWKAASRTINCLFFICLLFFVLILPLVIFLVVPIVLPSSLDDTEGMHLHQTACPW